MGAVFFLLPYLTLLGVRFVRLHFFCFSIGRYASMQEASWNEIFARLSAIQRPPFDFSMAVNIIARCSGRFKLDLVEDVYVNGMFHSVCGLVTICIFQRELGDITKMEGGMTFCNMVMEADGKNGVVPAYEFTFNYLEDKNFVEYEPVYSDKDVRFFQDYRCDVSKLEASAAKGKKVEIPTYLIHAAHKAWMYIDIASKYQDQMERLVFRYLRKLVVILLPVLIVLLAWVVLETLRLIIVDLRVCAFITNRNFPGRIRHKKAQFYSPYIAAVSAFTHLCYKVYVEL